MKLYGTLEHLLSYEPRTAIARASSKEPKSQESALHGFMRGKLSTLSDILRDITKDIGSRFSLSAYMLGAIYGHYAYVSTKLHELDRWHHGANRMVDQRRSTLEVQIDRLKQEAREERVRSWQDVAKLKAELRGWLKQYRDSQLRGAVLNGSKNSR